MLVIKDLYKKFGNHVAVAGLDLQVAKGETVVLMGPSGCGKSTTIRMINRLVEPDRGKVLFDGTEITTLSQAELYEIRKRIGFVFQHFNLIARLTAVENVMLGPVMSGLPRELAYEQAKAALQTVGMESCCDQKSSELSGGQQQRVGIARALAAGPELMLWDEPTASLDPILVREVLVIMEELARYGHNAMLVVTHELPFALHAADQIVLMDSGRVVETGPPDVIFRDPVSAIGCRYKELIEYQMDAGRLTGSKLLLQEEKNSCTI
jgi:polar amino acid transport system ATP-binding protein